jgi:hypothetical protein
MKFLEEVACVLEPAGVGEGEGVHDGAAGDRFASTPTSRISSRIPSFPTLLSRRTPSLRSSGAASPHVGAARRVQRPRVDVSLCRAPRQPCSGGRSRREPLRPPSPRVGTALRRRETRRSLEIDGGGLAARWGGRGTHRWSSARGGKEKESKMHPRSSDLTQSRLSHFQSK